MHRRTAILRADTAPVADAGGALRLLAIGQSLRDRGMTARFALNPGGVAMADLIQRAGFDVDTVWAASGNAADARAVIELARTHRADTVIADGPSFGSSYYDALTGEGLFTVAIDDAGRTLPVDVHVNTSLVSDPPWSKRPTATRELIGAPYALLRSEFLDHPPALAEADSAYWATTGRPLRLLVTFGAADSTHAAARILDLLPGNRSLAVTLVRGPLYADGGQLEQAAERACLRGHAVEILGATDRLAQHMASADAAICSGGNTLWELAYFGTPTLAFITSGRQETLVSGLARHGAIHGGCWLHGISDDRARQLVDGLLDDTALRGRLHRAFSTFVDGLGAARIAAQIDGVHGRAQAA